VRVLSITEYGVRLLILLVAPARDEHGPCGHYLPDPIPYVTEWSRPLDAPRSDPCNSNKAIVKGDRDGSRGNDLPAVKTCVILSARMTQKRSMIRMIGLDQTLPPRSPRPACRDLAVATESTLGPPEIRQARDPRSPGVGNLCWISVPTASTGRAHKSARDFIKCTRGLRGLALPDFRAAVRTFSCLRKSPGRAGRGERGGRVLTQTYHRIIIFASCCAQDYAVFTVRRFVTRNHLYPPFVALALFWLHGPDLGRLRRLHSVYVRN